MENKRKIIIGYLLMIIFFLSGFFFMMFISEIMIYLLIIFWLGWGGYSFYLIFSKDTKSHGIFLFVFWVALSLILFVVYLFYMSQFPY